MEQEETPASFFGRVRNLASVALDAQIRKAEEASKPQNQKAPEDDGDLFYAKTLTQDPSFAIHSQGWKEKPHRLQNAHLKQMSYKSSIIAAIIQARQNQISNYSALDLTGNSRGWRITIKNERRLIQEIKDGLSKGKAAPKPQASMIAENKTSSEDIDWRINREAKKKLEEELCEARSAVEDYIANCGLMENRPFETKRWVFDHALRAWVRDSLTYDMYASEVVPDRSGNPHHFFPVDASTIKYASPALKNAPYGDGANQIELDILYPEKEAAQIQAERIVELDQKKLEDEDYRFVQVVRGRVERAYTEEELKIGIRNPTTDIYNNGYGISELELIVSLVTGHLNSEFYNQSYFTQGFSAKGILHIKANINRRKLETVRQQWQHMLRGSRNSFQTPIFAGVDGVEWIKLDQKHNDIGFEHWLRYLTKMICSIYQIDPSELGLGFKEEGGSQGGGMSGDNTQEKLAQSRDRGLFPLLRHIQDYINTNILPLVDSRFCFEFTGVTNETEKERIALLESLSKFAKTLNEVRAELDLPPLPWGDELVLSREYIEWYAAHNGLNLNNQTPEDEKKKPNTSNKEGEKPKKPDAPEKKDSAEKIAKAKEIKVQYLQIIKDSENK